MCLSCLCIYGCMVLWLYVSMYGGAINTYICIYVFTQDSIYVFMYRRMYVYTYVCIYVYTYIHNAAFMVLCIYVFTQGSMYGMVVWLYVYTYMIRVAYHKRGILSSNLRSKIYENVFSVLSM
jgi:hypothetical protein